MSEKRFFTKINNKGRLVIIDKECHTELFDMTLACDVLNRLDLKLKTHNEQLGEQQDTIFKLQDLCGKSDGENAKLRIENKKLKEENEQLRRLFEEMKQPITINLTEEDEKELRKLLGLIDDE